MCDTKSVLMTGLAAATVFTGGAALGAAGLVGGMGAAGSMAGVAAGLGATGMLLTAYGQNEQAIGQKRLADRNAQIGELQAADAVARGAKAEEAHRAQVRQLEGQARAQAAATGGVMDTGSLDSVQTEIAKTGELDALTIRRNAQLEAWGYKNQADTSRYQGELINTKRKWDAMGSILTTGSQAYGIYKRGA